MTQSFSKNTKAVYKKHFPFEVATNSNDAKLIAEAQGKNHRYQYMAHCVLAGNADIRPYDPIYLDNLPNGMSGYWTVISVTHRFGGKSGYYMLDVLVGTDIIGETNPNASTAVAYRDVDSELNNQSLVTNDSMLQEYSVSPNDSTLPAAGTDVRGPKVTPKASFISNITTNPYAVYPPTAATPKRTAQWKAAKGNKVVE